MIMASSSAPRGADAEGAVGAASCAAPAGAAAPVGRRPFTSPPAPLVTAMQRRPSPGQASSSVTTRRSGAALASSQATSACGRLVLSGTTTAPASQTPSMQTKNWSYSSR